MRDGAQAQLDEEERWPLAQSAPGRRASGITVRWACGRRATDGTTPLHRLAQANCGTLAPASAQRSSVARVLLGPTVLPAQRVVLTG
jgi:hypothetical protein